MVLIIKEETESKLAAINIFHILWAQNDFRNR